jgi:hypothetical protein
METADVKKEDPRVDDSQYGAPLATAGPNEQAPTKLMPPCVTCGHSWGMHAKPADVDYDIDNGERWCFALTADGECRCKNWVAP